VPPGLIPKAPLRNQRGFLVSPKFQKRSALKFAGRTIPDAKRSGISDTFKIFRKKAKRNEVRESNYPRREAEWD